MRYMLNINPAGATALLDTIPTTDELHIEFRQPAKGLANGAVTQVRLTEGRSSLLSGVFRPRDSIGNR